jgi:phage/plasmid-like protein (TIGR03299 family)
MDITTALRACRADYTVDSTPVFYNVNGEFVENPDYRHIYRTDNKEILGLVTKGYGIVQNEEAFEFVNDLCCGGNSNTPFIEAAGVLGHGERVFVTAKFPEEFQIGDTFDDHGEMYAVITTSHDGSGAVTVLMTPIRVVCNNTLQYAMYQNNISKFSFKHTSGVKARMSANVQHAAQVLHCYDATMTAIKAQTELLSKTKVNTKLIQEVVGNVAFGDKYEVFKIEGIESENLSSQSKNMFNGILKSIDSGVGQEIFKEHNGNWLFNGISSFFQNSMSYGSHGVKDNPERKFDNFFGGTVHRKLTAAYANIIGKSKMLKVA